MRNNLLLFVLQRSADTATSAQNNQFTDRITTSDLLSFAEQILSAIEYLSSKNVILMAAYN
jgi:hypothetical protein